MMKVIGKIVKKHVTEPAPQDKGNDQNKVKIFKMFIEFFEVVFFNLVFHKDKCREKAKDIHKPVPPDLQRAECNNYGVYVWIG